MSEDLKDLKPIRKLTPLETKQLDYLVGEYPHLPRDVLETVIRLTDKQKDEIVKEIKDGELKLEETKPAEEYTIQSVSVE